MSSGSSAGADAAPCGRRCAVPGVFHLKQRRADEGDAGGAVFQDNHFLLIDEPTNHLDQEGRDSVREYLKGKKGFILVSPRPGFSRPVRGSCAGHQPDGYRGVQRKFFDLVGGEKAPGCLGAGRERTAEAGYRAPEELSPGQGAVGRRSGGQEAWKEGGAGG